MGFVDVHQVKVAYSNSKLRVYYLLLFIIYYLLLIIGSEIATKSLNVNANGALHKYIK